MQKRQEKDEKKRHARMHLFGKLLKIYCQVLVTVMPGADIPDWQSV